MDPPLVEPHAALQIFSPSKSSMNNSMLISVSADQIPELGISVRIYSLVLPSAVSSLPLFDIV